MEGPAIYSGAYPNILHRGLGLGQWTDTADGSTRHTALLNYARTQNKKWYDLDLQLDFMLHGDSPYYQSWLKDFFKNTASAANIWPNSSSPIGREILVTNYWKDKPEQRNGIIKLKKALVNPTAGQHKVI